MGPGVLDKPRKHNPNLSGAGIYSSLVVFGVRIQHKTITARIFFGWRVERDVTWAAPRPDCRRRKGPFYDSSRPLAVLCCGRTIFGRRLDSRSRLTARHPSCIRSCFHCRVLSHGQGLGSQLLTALHRRLTTGSKLHLIWDSRVWALGRRATRWPVPSRHG